jgi:iron uptake system EfeUOB component EfeO/EfeM
MRTRTIGQLAIIALIVTACGSAGGQSPSAARPPNPVNLTVYVNDSRVSVSPRTVGAGPLTFIVTNQASQAEALAISKGGSTLASTPPINPQGTTQVSVNFRPGRYIIATGTQGKNDAQLSKQSSIRPASLHIGRERESSANSVLQP